MNGPAQSMAEENPAGTPRGLVPLLLCVIPLSQIPLDIYTPALPDMVVDLHSDNMAVQNTVTAYMLGMSFALIPMGMVADACGRRPTLLVSMALLVAASIACALAPSVPVLTALRFVQAVGASACMVVTYAIAADCFRGARLTAVSGILGMAWGLAPVLAPAAGGFIAQYATWRVIFGLIALLAAGVALAVLAFLPETLPREKRSPIRVGDALGVMGSAMQNLRFVNFTLIFAAMASAQLVFGVVAPFLYQKNLGFSAAAYGLIALVLGAANLSGELACSTLATRTTPRQLCFGAWAVFTAGALTLALSGTFGGVTLLALTLGGALSLAGCGTLCPTMYGMALGLFSRNLGLLGGFITAVCYLAVSLTMALAAYLPESSQAPLGWVFTGLGAIAFLLLALSLASPEKAAEPLSA